MDKSMTMEGMAYFPPLIKVINTEGVGPLCMSFNASVEPVGSMDMMENPVLLKEVEW